MSETTPKRKRHDADADSSRKRRSAEKSANHIKVKVREDVGSHKPVFASAPGIGLSSLTFTPYTRSGDETSVQSLHLHSADHPRLDYSGSIELTQPIQHVLGIFDAAKQSLELLPAHAITVRSTLWQELLEVEFENENRSRMQQREALGMEFGTKKAKKAIASKTINAINSNTAKDIEQATLEGIDSTAGLPTRDEQDSSVLASKPIPQPNLDATEVDKIYSLETLIPAADLRGQAVKEWQDAVKANEAIEVSSRYVANRIKRVVDRGDAQRLKALKYLLLVIEFAGTLIISRHGRKIPKKDILKEKLSQWPEPAVDAMRRRFAEGGELNKWHFDRLMTHAAAISLYIDGWKTEISDLREDLRQENRQMAQYFHELGCKSRSPYESEYSEFKIQSKAQAAQRKVVVLKLPLEFPKTRNPPRRR